MTDSALAGATAGIGTSPAGTGTPGTAAPAGVPARPADGLRVVHAGLVDYRQAWERQRRLQGERIENRAPDTLLLLEHPSVYTAGKRTEPADRPMDGTPVVDVDRGGKITWHGPGQLVGYPIVRLPDPVDVVAYVRRVEALLMAVCADLGVATKRVEGRSGVWLSADERGVERKIGAVGIRVTRGVTMHGFQLNCDCDMSAYDRIVPCGIRDAGVTSLSLETDRAVTVAEAAGLVEAHLDELYPR